MMGLKPEIKKTYVGRSADMNVGTIRTVRCSDRNGRLPQPAHHRTLAYGGG